MLARAPRWLLAFCLLLHGPVSMAKAADSTAEARQAWQLLEYIAVDYPGAVSAGQVRNAGEYAEMREFAGAVRAKLAALPAAPGAADRNAAAANLESLVAARAAPQAIAQAAHALSHQLLAAYAIEAAPAQTPDVTHGGALYAQQCAGCHGAHGAADGPLAARLDPPPVAFTDHDRAARRTPLALYQVISQGLTGTAMPSFAHLSAEDRWDLAFYASDLSANDAMRAQGASAWERSSTARTAIPDLAALAQTSEQDLATRVQPAVARAILAYLRSSPAVLAASKATPAVSSLAVARERLTGAISAYQAGRPEEASRLALSSYLDGIEPIEPTLATRDPALLRDIESKMASLRSQIQHGAPAEVVAAQAGEVETVFGRIEATLNDHGQAATTVFLGSFTILVREGLEALLIVVGMLAFLRKAERRDVVRYVHAGWIGALLAGGVTWVLATHLVSISGANREVTEGLSSLFAAGVLLSVGIWMHGKSVAGRWQEYLHARMSAALTARSAAFLFMLSFVAVYREVFETILFYAAMWTPQDSTAIVAGLGAGVVVLGLVAFALLRAGMRLPIGTFFAASAMLIAVLAVVLVGKGVAALQEAGWVSQALLAAPRIEWLGVYPTWQSLLAQVVVAIVATGGYLWAARDTRPRALKQG